jgi:hypothetical protein
MGESVKTGLLAAYVKLLRPLVRILLRHGVTYAEFSEVVKTSFVTVAAKEFRVPGKKMSKARIAIVTGLTRKEVQRLSSIDQEEQFKLKTNLNRITRVLSGWHTDPDYTGPYGVPLEIRYDSDIPNDVTFVRLVQQYSGDMTPRAMLDELLRVKSVIETDHNWFKVLRRTYVPEALAPDALERLGIGVHDYVQTMEVNMQKTRPGAGLFERFVAPEMGLKEKDLPEFDEYIRERCQALLEEIDNWLSKKELPDVEKGDKALRTGIGIFHFVSEKDDEVKNIRELLEDRSMP